MSLNLKPRFMCLALCLFGSELILFGHLKKMLPILPERHLACHIAAFLGDFPIILRSTPARSAVSTLGLSAAEGISNG